MMCVVCLKNSASEVISVKCPFCGKEETLYVCRDCARKAEEGEIVTIAIREEN